MKIKNCLLLAFLCCMGIQLSFGQVKNEPQKPYYIGLPDKVEKVPSIASRRANLIRPDLSKHVVMRDGRDSKYDVVIGKGSTGDDVLAKNKHRLAGKIPTKSPELVFETGASSSSPTDPAGAVGPNHYISVINTAFQIFDKDGNSLTGGLVSPNPTIFPSGGCCDLTASYDNDADRWVLSFLGGGVQVAVSDGPDPVNDGWTVYTYGAVSDYQKLSVWRDGYYMTENTSGSNKLHVFERAAMIDAASAGTTPQILSFSLPGMVTSGFHSPQVLNISGGTWPSSGGATIVYMQDDAWGGVSEDHIKVWTATMDWANPGNSSVSAAQQLGASDGVTSFISVFDGGSFSNLTQPNGGIAIDALQATIMNQAQFRKFPGYNSALFNFVVDVDGSSTEQAGVRWYELRQTADGQPWTVHQEGTYTAPDNRHAWNASMIMDLQGNIGMGYSSMSSANSTNSQVRVGSYYSGRYVGDPLGTMTIAEEVIVAGDANIPGLRYGDYSKIDVDPANDKKFWFVNEVMSNGRKNVAGVFQIAPNYNNDVGVVNIDSPSTGALSANQTITVTVFNFGENTASNFDVTYQVDGGAVITEAYNGAPIPKASSAQFTFGTTANLGTEGQTYSIVAKTVYGSDQDNSNDATTQQVLHVFSKDLGVTAITAPSSGESIANETITVSIKNFGTATQSNFDVSYTINGGAAVVEQVPGPLAGGATTSYSFSTLGNFSNDGTYTLVARTQLTNDSDASNDAADAEIVNSACNTTTNDTDHSIGPDSGTVTESIITITDNVVIQDVNVTLNIEHTFDDDLDIKLIGPNGTEVILVEDEGSSGDNFTNTVFDDDAATSIEDGSAPFTGVFRPEGNLADFIGLSSAGDWTLHITDDANLDGGNLLSWSLQLCVDSALSNDDTSLPGDFKVYNRGGNQFGIELTTTATTEKLDLNVFNVMGQKLLWKTLHNNGGRYTYELNMAHASPGVYIIRLGKGNKGITRKIVRE